MDREGHVIIAMAVNPVAVPAFTQIEIIHAPQIILQLLRIIRKTQLLEPGIHQHVEEQPVAVIAGMGVDLIQPEVQMILFLRSKR